MGDYHDMHDRLRNRCDKIFAEPARKHLPLVTGTIVTSGLHTTQRDEQLAAYQREAFDGFIKVLSEEAEAQWDRIVDRRMSDWFYSGVMGFVLGVLVSKI
jgi:hypothetical protein